MPLAAQVLSKKAEGELGSLALTSDLLGPPYLDSLTVAHSLQFSYEGTLLVLICLSKRPDSVESTHEEGLLYIKTKENDRGAVFPTCLSLPIATPQKKRFSLELTQTLFWRTCALLESSFEGEETAPQVSAHPPASTM